MPDIGVGSRKQTSLYEGMIDMRCHGGALPGKEMMMEQIAQDTPCSVWVRSLMNSDRVELASFAPTAKRWSGN